MSQVTAKMAAPHAAVVIKVIIHMIVPLNRCELLVHNTRRNTVILQTHIQK